MKKLLLAFSMLLGSMVAMAAATPREIEAALAANNLAEAQAMTTTALKEHPNSPRAHLFEAYLLIHARHDAAGAARELALVDSLDQTGATKHSALFGRTAAEIQTAPQVAPRTIPVAPPMTVAPAPSHAAVWPWVLLTMIFGLGIVIWLATRPSRVATDLFIGGSPGTAAYSGYSGGPRPVQPTGGVVYTSSPGMMAGGNGLGGLGTAAAVAGGVVAGEFLADELLHRHSSPSTGRSDNWDNSPTPPAITPTPLDTAVTADSFDSGGSSWDDSSSSSSSDSGSSWDDSISSSDDSW